MEAIIYTGIPGSGKSTHYQNNFKDTHLRINLDMLNRRSREWNIFEAAVKSRTKIVIDNTNIDIEKRKKYIDILKQYKYKIISYYFAVNVETALKRNNSRKRIVPENAIEEYQKNLVVPSKEEGFNIVRFVYKDGK